MAHSHDNPSDSHDHAPGHPHGHSHGSIHPAILSHERGIWAVKWSFVLLLLTAVFQIVVVLLSNSVALLADTVHNLGDAATAVPLGIAFAFKRLKPNNRFTYGYGRVEDLAGVVVVLIILFSAVFAGYQAVERFFHPQMVTHVWAIAVASLVGFFGNEAVAVFRIRVGKEIGSAALVADGYHARVDGYTSLAVLLGALGVWWGFPLADPIIGLVISITLLFVVRDSAKEVFVRMLDGVEPGILDQITHAAKHADGVIAVGETKARWIGHKLHIELSVSVRPDLSVATGDEIARDVRQELTRHFPHLGSADVRVRPFKPVA